MLVRGGTGVKLLDGKSPQEPLPTPTAPYRPLPPLVCRLPDQGQVARVAGLDLRGGIDEVHGVVYGNARFRDAGRDELELAGIGRDVPRGEDAGEVRSHRRGDLDIALLELEPP